MSDYLSVRQDVRGNTVRPQGLGCHIQVAWPNDGTVFNGCAIEEGDVVEPAKDPASEEWLHVVNALLAILEAYEYAIVG